jgi:hypothetical protein
MRFEFCYMSLAFYRILWNHFVESDLIDWQQEVGLYTF